MEHFASLFKQHILSSITHVAALSSKVVNFLTAVTVSYSSLFPNTWHLVASQCVCPIEDCSSNKSSCGQGELPLIGEMLIAIF